MLFDMFAKVVEKHFPQYRKVLEDARIFKLEGAPHEFLPKTVTAEQLDAFRLPFPVVAIEDDATVIILMDTEPDQRGGTGLRLWIEYVPPKSCTREGAFENKYISGKPRPADVMNLLGDSWHRPGNSWQAVSEGYFERITAAGSSFEVVGGFARINVIMSGKPYDLTAYQGKDYANNMVREAFVAVPEIIYFSQPDLFILEEAPLKQPKSFPKQKKIPRTHQRPLYTVLRPADIRSRMRLPEPASPGHGTHKSPRPHERRRHERFLSDDIYSRDERGDLIAPRPIPYGPRKGQPYYKRVDVPAIWVGPTENRVGNKLYRVRTDL